MYLFRAMFFYFLLCKTFTSAVIYTVPWYIIIYSVYLYTRKRYILYITYNKLKCYTCKWNTLKYIYTACILEKSPLLQRIYQKSSHGVRIHLLVLAPLYSILHSESLIQKNPCYLNFMNNFYGDKLTVEFIFTWKSGFIVLFSKSLTTCLRESSECTKPVFIFHLLLFFFEVQVLYFFSLSSVALDLFKHFFGNFFSNIFSFSKIVCMFKNETNYLSCNFLLPRQGNI